MGSSPLTRGKPVAGDRGEPGNGLIPAHAGKTTGIPSPLGSWWAHPRSRGENREGHRRTLGGEGSSPLTRGKLIDWFKTYLLPGLIPAHAGKTHPLPVNPTPVWAHPRSRGENLNAWVAA